MRMSPVQRPAVLAVLAILVAVPARADVLFSSFPYSSGGGWSAVGPLEPLGQPEVDIACDIHVPEGTSYGSIVVQLALDNWWGTRVADVMIVADTLDGTPFPTPGRVLATQSTLAPVDPGIVSVAFPAELLLVAGKTYWVALSTPGDGMQSWRWSVGLTGDYRAYRLRSSGWWSESGQFCAFAVEGTPFTTAVPIVDASNRGALTLACWPSPFIISTTLAYTLEQEAAVSLSVYDVSGRMVRTLIAGERQEPAQHRVAWDGSTAGGVKAAPGVFIAVLQAGNRRATQRLVRIQ